MRSFFYFFLKSSKTAFNFQQNCLYLYYNELIGMEETLNSIYEVLIGHNINKKNIRKFENRIDFFYKKIIYSVQIESTDELMYGPTEFENNAIDSDFLHDNYTEYGDLTWFDDYVYQIVKGDMFSDLYKITDALIKLEKRAELSTEVSINFNKLVNHMFINAN